MDIKKEIVDRALEIENRIRHYMPEEADLQHTITEAMEYSVFAGGKRLRPMLMEAAYRMYGGNGKEIEPFMAAIEMIHTYSLVHDDLPAMDNDEYRRGKKTTHAVYGEAMGILAGDALLNYAYETVAKAMQTFDDPKMIPAFSILAQKAGIYGMVGGQVVDVESEKKHLKVDKEKLNFIYRLKTSALIEAALMIGAVLAGAEEKEIRQMETAGNRLGLAFQIQDDILDVTGTLEELGKPIGSDARNEKVTYVTFEGIGKAEQDVKKLSEEAVSILEECKGEHTFLRELFLYLIHRKK